MLVTGRDKKGRQGIYQIDAQTSNVTPIVQSDLGVSGPEWSPDGRGIFYRRSESSTKKTSIVVRDLGTGGEKELYGAFGSSFLGYNLPLSPDGGQLAFTINDQATRSSILKVMPAVGGEARELLRLQQPESIGLPVWTPDGREILFARSRSSSLDEWTRELWRISAEGGEPQKLELAMERLRDLRFHPDGKRVVFTAGKGEAEVWVMENFLPKAEVQAARLEE